MVEVRGGGIMDQDETREMLEQLAELEVSREQKGVWYGQKINEAESTVTRLNAEMVEDLAYITDESTALMAQIKANVHDTGRSVEGTYLKAVFNDGPLSVSIGTVKETNVERHTG